MASSFFLSLLLLALLFHAPVSTLATAGSRMHTSMHAEADAKPAAAAAAKPAAAAGAKPAAAAAAGAKPAAAGAAAAGGAAGDNLAETTAYKGAWRIDNENAGVSAMHLQLMPNNQVVWFDSTSNGISEILQNPPFCKGRIGGRPNDPKLDCTAHAVAYDAETAKVRPFKLPTSPWCSSGILSRNGDLISTGGDKDGFRSVRVMKPCPTCEFEERNPGLYTNRWYATNHHLENGSVIVVGGRNAFNYEILPGDGSLEYVLNVTPLPILAESCDDNGRENNLYPFLNLLPDGNMFILANYKAIAFNPLNGKTVKTYPDLTGARNYPPSGMSALLPIDLNLADPVYEVMVCGGNSREAYLLSDLQQPKREFLPALKDCGRINLMKEAAAWETEDMPTPRVMGDMLVLPNGDVLMLNGAKAGTSAWNAAAEPNLTPVLYSPTKPKGQRFKELAPTNIARMYHSSSAVLPSGEVLVAGSNTNAFYMLPKYNDKFTFPSELRVEKFTPPYLDPALIEWRMEITAAAGPLQLKYGAPFTINVTSKKGPPAQAEVKVTMYAPPFTTHGYSHNQRLIILKMVGVKENAITVDAPPSGKIAPPGMYLIFAVRKGIPSRGVWATIA